MKAMRQAVLPLLGLLLCAAACNQPAESPPKSAPSGPPAAVPGEPPAAPAAPADAPTEPAGPESTKQTPAEAPAAVPPASPAPAAVTPSAQEPIPATPPAPQMVTLPAGTKVKIEFIDGVGSKISHAGDSFKVRVAEDVLHQGQVAIPAGAVLRGSVTEAKPLAKIGGTARLTLAFDHLEIQEGQVIPFRSFVQKEGKSETRRDAAAIGGAAAGGALIGNVVSKKEKGKGTLVGALVGAAAGAAIAAETKGEEIEFGPGTRRNITLEEPTQVPLRR